MEWINVQDRLPNPDQKVLCFADSEIYLCEYMESHEEKYFYSEVWDYNTSRKRPEITHWMPLPKPPKE